MAKVTVHETPAETPSQGIVKAATAVTQVTDARGRAIGVRRMNALDRLKMLECVGPENSKNEMYLGYAGLAFMVASVDGEAVPRPANRLQLEALVQRLDDDGLNAVAGHVASQAAPEGDAEAELKNG